MKNNNIIGVLKDSYFYGQIKDFDINDIADYLEDILDIDLNSFDADDFICNDLLALTKKEYSEEKNRGTEFHIITEKEDGYLVIG